MSYWWMVRYSLVAIAFIAVFVAGYVYGKIEMMIVLWSLGWFG